METIERFMNKVSKKKMGYKTECWMWMAYRNKFGYGVFRGDKSKHPSGYKGRLAHRWVYEHFIGKIESGFEIDHLCRNKGCVNPEHLRQVTHQENMLGLLYTQRTTHCPKGHPYSGDNLYIRTRTDGRVYKMCRICKRDSERKFKELNRDKLREKSLEYYHRNNGTSINLISSS